MEKTCIKCKAVKHKEEFYDCKHTKDKKLSYCKECQKSMSRARYAHLKENQK